MATSYGVGVIGTSWAARSPLPTFQSYEGVNLVAVCSGQLARAQATAEQFGAPVALDDYRKLVALPEVDIVYVGSPVGLHHPMAIAAAEAGKHLLCEKPLALNAERGREMLAAAQGAGVAHIVAFTMRHFATHVLVRQLVEEGVIGEPRHLAITQFGGSAVGSPPRGWSWWSDRAKGGGLLGAMGSHYIDLTRYWLGDFAEVSGRLRTWQREAPDDAGQMHEVTSDDGFAIAGTMRSGAAVTVHMSYAVRPGPPRRIELYGDQGTVVIEGDELAPGGAQVLVARAGESTLSEVEVPPLALGDAARASTVPRFGLMIEKLLRAIESGERQSPDIEDSLRCQEVLDAVRRSSDEGGSSVLLAD
jgi:predicted dehydrogenase